MELRECPFCGAQPEQADVSEYYVECPSCGLQGPYGEKDTYESSIAAWNRRASPASVPEGWKHSCNALCLDGVELWVPQCPHCGRPAPTPPVSEDRKGAERYRVLKSGDFSVEQFVSSSYGWKFVPMEELDAAIDQAMQEDKP